MENGPFVGDVPLKECFSIAMLVWQIAFGITKKNVWSFSEKRSQSRENKWSDNAQAYFVF